MANRTVRFLAFKTAKKPTTIKFKTKSGKTVSFKAVKTFRKRQAVRFRAKKDDKAHLPRQQHSN